MAVENLVPNSEAEGAKIELLQQEICAINFGNYQLMVTLDRFQLSTEHTPFFPVIYDLVLGMFRLLRHTPLTKLGINSEEHYKLKDTEEWHRFGHLIAPKAGIWDKVLTKPGLRSMTIEGIRPGSESNGATRVTVAPVGDENLHTVSIGLNDEFVVEDDQKQAGTQALLDCLERQWTPSHELFRKSVQHLLGLATER